MKNILIITPFFRPNIGGAETYVHELCEHLRTHNYYVYVLTYQPMTTPRLKGACLEKLHHLEIRRFWWLGHDLFHKMQKYPFLVFIYITPYLFLRCFIWTLKNSHKIDVIDTQGLNAAFIGRILKWLFKKKVTNTIVSLYNFVPGSFFARLVNFTLSGLDHIIVEKGKSKEELVNIGIPEDKFVVFNQWVDQARFQPTDKQKSKQGLGYQGQFIVLFVGRPIAEKGAEILLDASFRVNPKIIFIFITGLSPATTSIVRAAKVRSNIIFIGEVEYDKLHKYYQAADILCIPSCYEEGIARVIPEAISCGTPVIASNRGSIPYVLDERVSILTEPTAENLAQSIEYLYNNRPILKQLQANCPSYALENFSNKNIKIISNAYQR